MEKGNAPEAVETEVGIEAGRGIGEGLTESKAGGKERKDLVREIVSATENGDGIDCAALELLATKKAPDLAARGAGKGAGFHEMDFIGGETVCDDEVSLHLVEGGSIIGQGPARALREHDDAFVVAAFARKDGETAGDEPGHGFFECAFEILCGVILTADDEQGAATTGDEKIPFIEESEVPGPQPGAVVDSEGGAESLVGVRGIIPVTERKSG